MVTIKVISKSTGRPYQGISVSLGFGGFFGTHTGAEYTDSNGEAHFRVDPQEGKVYVDGRTKWEGFLKGRIVVYE